MKSDDTPISEADFSRRKFIQDCAVGIAVLGSGPLLAFTDPGNKKGPARRVIPLNQNWLFGGKMDPSSLGQNFSDKGFSPVTLPHCVTDLSWHDWDVTSWQTAWAYSNHFSFPKELMGMRVFLHFEGVLVGTYPSINGHQLTPHYGGYLPFSYEITEWVHAGENTLLTGVDARWSNVPPDGHPDGANRVDFLEPGGIHREVWLEAVPKVYISDVFAKPVDVLTHNRHIETRCTIDAGVALQKPVVLQVEMKESGRVISRARKEIRIEKTGQTEITLNLANLGNVILWDVDNPKLYDIETTLLVGGSPLHNHKTRTGLRDARFTVDGFFLNGRRLQIFGLNRHEVYPYAGFAMPDRVMRHDAEMLRKEFNCNMVRCSHYPQREAFLDACDELGMMVWEETPGWGYIGDDAWKELLVRDVRDMIIRDRNHPSIIIWGTRANESRNEVELYKRTRALAQTLDGTRPSSGSMTSHTTGNGWDEDVFSYDDYHGDGKGNATLHEPIKGVPYLVSEAVGQFNYEVNKGFTCMYSRDATIHIQQLQAINHAQAHEKAAENSSNCGVIGWCAFEYSSPHNSAKGIKNPGVADVFRIPKLGASFYQSQRDIKKGAVIHPNFYWDFGAQTPSGPGKNAAIFSNCDRLELFVNGQHHSTLQPDRKRYPKLKYAPFFADLELSGTDFPELRIDGYVKDEKKISRNFSSNPHSDQFLVVADDKELIGNGSDGTRVVFRVTDKYGAPRPFAEGIVNFQIKGPGVIVGDKQFDLKPAGGAAAIWVRTKPNTSGTIVLEATHSTFGTKTVQIVAGKMS